MDSRIATILEHWFICEPALFSILCAFELTENFKMFCPFRCGQHRVEYNPEYVKGMNEKTLEEALKTEAIRLLLKHPYERKPEQCCSQAISLGSNVCIGDQYVYNYFKIENPDEFSLPRGQVFEWYALQIQKLFGTGEITVESDYKCLCDLCELWAEDEITVVRIDEVIGTIKSWGSLSGTLEEKIKSSSGSKINWRKALSGFRTSVLNKERKLSRMRPNRRTGFENMGYSRCHTAKLLISVDVSGSISSEELSRFFGVVNSALRYGFTDIDVVQFDSDITRILNLKTAIRDMSVKGRGGTSFEPPIEYAANHNYDGLVILTDGYAASPVIPEKIRGKILWCCKDRKCYDRNYIWMKDSGRACLVDFFGET